MFISSITGEGLTELKDVLWSELNSESNKLQSVVSEDSIVHRDKDMQKLTQEMIDEQMDDDIEFVDEDEIEDVEDLEDFEYDDK